MYDLYGIKLALGVICYFAVVLGIIGYVIWKDRRSE
jgi:hypothetical protein